jgi:hypothetical protein
MDDGEREIFGYPYTRELLAAERPAFAPTSDTAT